MRIGTKLTAAILAPLSLAFIICLTLTSTYMSVETARSNGDKIRQVRNSITQLNHIVIAFVAYREDRPKAQFLAEHEALLRLVNSIQTKEPVQQAIVNDILANSRSIKDLFLKFVAAVDTPYAIDREKVFSDSVQQIEGQLMLRTYMIDSAASQLRYMADKDIQRYLLRAFVVISVAVALSILSLVIILIRTRKSIVASLSRLRAGAKELGAGNLDHVIDVGRKDEMGEVAEAFNAMAGNLKTVTASKTDLEREVAARTRAEEALRHSEARLQQALRIGRSFAFEWNPATDEVVRSESCATILGLSGDEIMYDTGKTFFTRVHKDDVERFTKLLASLNPSSTTYHTEYRVVRQDGAVIDLEELGEGFFDSDGALQRVVGTTLDITARKKAEESLRENERRFRTMFEHHKAPMLLIEPEDGAIVGANKAAAEFYGYTIGQLTAMHIQDINQLPPEQVADERQKARMEQANHFSFHHRLADGRLRRVDVYSTPFEAQGRTLLFSIIHDVTEREEAKDELRKSLERLNIISDTASQLLFTDDPQKVLETLCHRVMDHLECDVFFNFLTDDAMNCLRLNAYAGIDEETARTIQFLDYGVAVCGCAARDARRIVAENIPTTPDIRTDLVRSFGVKAYACHPLFAQGKVVGTLSFGTKSRTTFTEDELSLMKTVADQVATALERKRLLESEIERGRELETRVQERTAELEQAYERLEKEMAERTRIEAQLRHSQKMEAIGTLAGGIAHDFNNILAAIIGFAEMIEEDIPLGKPRVQHAQRVINAATRGRELVQQILAFSRKTEHARHPLSLSAITKETAQLLRASIPSTIDIALDIVDASDTILATPVELQQILMNLATNAALSMEEKGGAIQIGIKGINLDADSTFLDAEMVPGDYVQLVVSDTGSGMPHEVMERIFEPYFTTREVGKGTGMGLAVVYGIVKSLHGNIKVDSEPGVGTTISVLFPKAVVGADAGADSLEQAQGGKERILFVDDEEFLVEWGRVLLERLGYEVTALDSSEEALKIFSAEPSRFDLVITDQTMPVLTGLQLAGQILRLRPDIPIMLCTGHSEAVTRDGLKGTGIRELLMKPLTRKDLAEAIRRALNKGGQAEILTQ